MEAHPSTHVVEHERLLRLGESDFPGCSRVLERVQWACAGSTVVPRHQNHIGLRFGDTRCHRTNTRLAHELHVNIGRRVRAFEVEDELFQVFNRIDVVVRGWRNEAHTGSAMTQTSNPGVHLVRRKLSTFAGFCPLRHLDLNIGGVGEVETRHSETSRSHLLDP